MVLHVCSLGYWVREQLEDALQWGAVMEYRRAVQEQGVEKGPRDGILRRRLRREHKECNHGGGGGAGMFHVLHMQRDMSPAGTGGIATPKPCQIRDGGNRPDFFFCVVHHFKVLTTATHPNRNL
jgi:hypothetical protein